MALVPTPCVVLLIVAWQITTETRAFFFGEYLIEM